MRARRAFAVAWLGLAALAPLGIAPRSRRSPAVTARIVTARRRRRLSTARRFCPSARLRRSGRPARQCSSTCCRDPRNRPSFRPERLGATVHVTACRAPSGCRTSASERSAPRPSSYFRRGLEAATKGDLSKPIVLFCQRECWMSWNAAKRALAFGYRRVFWFPDGSDGWSEGRVAAGARRTLRQTQRIAGGRVI